MTEHIKPISFFTVLRVTLPQIWKNCPFYFGCYFFFDILHGLSYGVNTYLMQHFFDSIENSLPPDSSQLHVYWYGTSLAVLLISTQLLDGAANFMYTSMTEKLRGYMNRLINKKSSRISAAAFESSAALDAINKALEGAEKSVELVLAFLSMLAFHIPYMIFMLFYLGSLNPLLYLGLLFLFLPVGLIQALRSGIFFRLEDISAPLRRKAAQYEKSIYGKEYLKETRLLGIFSYLEQKYTENQRDLHKAVWRAQRLSGYIETAQKCVMFSGYLFISGVLLHQVLQGKVTAGTFSAVYASVGLIFGIMQGIVDRNLGLISENMGYAANFINFLRLPEEQRLPAANNEDGDIVFSNVTFRYPQQHKPAIKNLNLRIRKGETLAIVGENGAGKSTFSLLLMGIYVPDSGNVQIGEYSTRQSLPYGHFTAVFQNFRKYKLTLRENVRISDSASACRDINPFLEEAGVIQEEDTFTDGSNTVLSPEFGGVELSGGQWQRIAIARGLYRPHKILVLDEPSSAIDPEAETQLYQNFMELSRDRTAVIITHRLGAARFADRIAVLRNGELTEQGNHESLMALNGEYCRMYHAQADWYHSC